MINHAELKNFGPIKELDWQNLGKINLIIGNNGCGKSFLLKALYSAVRTLEEYKRGDTPDSITDILKSKLYWTFQAEQIGNLVTVLDSNTNKIVEETMFDNLTNKPNEIKPLPDNIDLSFYLTLDQQKFGYGIGNLYLNHSYTYDFSFLDNQITPRSDNSIFLPAKEVLSLHHIILKSREQDKLYGFDDTYFDLAKALNQAPTKIPSPFGFAGSGAMGFDQGIFYDSNSPIRGHLSNDFNNARIKIRAMIDGEMEFDDFKKRWYFRKGKQRFPMGVTAEGNKKVAVLDNLLGNRYLNENSIIFIDEPESTLHPQYISELLDIIFILANHGIQFFIASHSYFVIKKLFLIAQEQQISIPVLSYQDDEWVQSDLLEEMPSNPIIKESIRLYKEEIFLASR